MEKIRNLRIKVRRFFINLIARIKHQYNHDWAIQKNKNGKPFKRQCCYCGLKEHRKNGEWVSHGHRYTYPRVRKGRF